MYRAEERQRRSLLAREVGVVPSPLTLDGALSAEENVLSPARLVGPVGNAERARASRLLVRLGLGERRNHRPEHLSGGERKRVAVARALMNDPAVVLADEPTGDLDSARCRQVMMLLRALADDDGKGVLVVASDPRVEEVADRILWLERGRIEQRVTRGVRWGRDPICGMRVDRLRAVARTERADEEVFFCSLRCHQQFHALDGPRPGL